MWNWLYNLIEKKFNEERINRWICAGATEGLKHYYQRYDRYPGYVVDIGAHHGSLSRAALEKGAKKVFALEASKSNYSILLKNLRKYPKHKHLSFNYAFTEDMCAEVKVISHKRGNSGQKSLLYVKRGDTKGYITEECLGLDRVGLLNMIHFPVIDYLKIDIEGNEFYALPFDDKTRKLLSKVRFLDIELHSLDNPKFFDKQAFLDTHRGYDPNKDMIIQFIEFLGTCGFYMPDRNVEGCGGAKIFTANRNMEHRLPGVRTDAE